MNYMDALQIPVSDMMQNLPLLLIIHREGIRSCVCRLKINCISKVDTYSMFSGLPVSVQGLSNMPPLSVRK